LPFFKLSPEEGDRLRKLLKERGLKEVEHQHALWAFEGEGFRVFYYPTGTLGVAGKREREAAEKLLRELRPRRVAGCDEAGKGDLFGPLVVCCACLEEKSYGKVVALNPRDTKRLSDKRLFELVKRLKPLVKVFCEEVSPERYNRLREEAGSVNALLDALYGRLLEKVRRECKPEEIVVDAYKRESPFEGVRFSPKGERYPAVSVASIFARYYFLKALERMEEELGFKPPKGAGEEAKGRAEGLSEKERFIKVHFNRRSKREGGKSPPR